MKIEKLGHACFVAEEEGVRVLFDPGSYASGYERVNDLTAIVITHEHKDHLHLDALRVLLRNNGDVRVISGSSIQKKLSAEGIVSEVLEGGDSTLLRGLSLVGFDAPHAEIYGPVEAQNVAYFLGGKLLHPGDSLFVPPVPVEILALPVAAPWMKLSEGISYALSLKAKAVFPIHDGMLIAERSASHYAFPEKILGAEGIRFLPMLSGSVAEF